MQPLAWFSFGALVGGLAVWMFIEFQIAMAHKVADSILKSIKGA